MPRNCHHKPDKGTFDSAWGAVSWSLYKTGQMRWTASDRKGKADIKKPGDNVEVAITAAMLESDSAAQPQPVPNPLLPPPPPPPPPQHAPPQTQDAAGRLRSDPRHMQ